MIEIYWPGKVSSTCLLPPLPPCEYVYVRRTGRGVVPSTVFQYLLLQCSMHLVLSRGTREGWPLMTVELWKLGENERGPSSVGSLGLSCRYKRFLSCLVALVGPYPHRTLFQLICPHRPASWAGSHAGSPISYVSLVLSNCFYHVLLLIRVFSGQFVRVTPQGFEKSPFHSSLPAPSVNFSRALMSPSFVGNILIDSKCYGTYLLSYPVLQCSGSGIRCLFDPGIRIGFFRIPDPRSRIPDPKTIFLRAY
jgi:hypothetical protein